MSAKEGLATAAVAKDRTDRPNRPVQLRSNLATAAFWLLGSALVAAAQPGTDRGIAAAGAAAAGIATILVVSRLTVDREQRYFRSIVGAMVAVSVVGDWLVQHLTSGGNGFVNYGFDTRIALPLIVVLLTPLVVRALPPRLRSRALWRERAQIWREARPFDWLAVAYVLLIVPDLLLGLAHHAPKTYIAQDLGLIVFFVFAYLAGRTIGVATGRAAAAEFVVVLLVLAALQALLSFDTTPIFTYVEAACAGGAAFAALLQPTKPRLLLLCLAVALLANDAVAITNGTGSTTGVELAASLGIVGYLLVRSRRLLPQWLVVAAAAAALVGYVAFSSDGRTVRGQYFGADVSNLGRTYEAHQVREATHTPVSFVFGRGLGGSIDETKAPKLFAESLVYGGRDLAHVQQVHLLPYEFLLKYGLLGFAWLAAFVVGVAILGIRALESAARHRDPTPVVYAALPILGIAAALAAATHLQDNPLIAFALGVLVTRFGGEPASRLRLGMALPVAAVVAAAVGGVAFSGKVGYFAGSSIAGVPNDAAFVGPLRVDFPRPYHHRYFVTTSHAITGAHNVRVHGVVVASYPLKPSPEVGGRGLRFRADGLFFELYQVPRGRHQPAAAKKLPLTIFDFPVIPNLKSPPTTEQGGALFSANGRNYRAILWIGKFAPKDTLLAIDDIVASIRINPRTGKPSAPGQPGTPRHRHQRSARHRTGK